uniref:DUF4806 domain-containing protein n=1 Tax=Schizaphis graminum TaxID=13262 RepID=A0A2S2PQU2_SCHGA
MFLKNIIIEVQKQIIRQLVTLNARIKEQSDYLHTIMMIVSDVQEKQKTLVQPIIALTSNHEFENAYKMLPIPNEDSLNSLKNILSNDVLHDQTVNMLSKIGGSNYKETVRRILRKLITDEFAKLFSYTGHKCNKKAFNKTILGSLLLKAVHSSSFNNTTIKDIEIVASIWLTKASERLKTTPTDFEV